MRILATIWLCLVSQLVFGSADYAREKKWADEITPGIVVGDPVYLELKSGLELKQGHKFLSLLTTAPDAKTALVVVHGLGIHPDWGLVGTLRTQLADLGYTTLSIQMPVLVNEAEGDQYVPTFPEAAARIAAAVDFFKAKGYKKIAIVSHSLGSRMSRVYVMKHQDQIVGWASLGIGGGDTYNGIKIPVLDLYGENDFPGVVKGAAARAASLKANAASKQVKVSKADHFFANREAEMVKAVKTFMDTLR